MRDKALTFTRSDHCNFKNEAETVRLGEWQRLEQNTAHDGKRRGVEANAQRECSEDNCCEAQILAIRSLAICKSNCKCLGQFHARIVWSLNFG